MTLNSALMCCCIQISLGSDAEYINRMFEGPVELDVAITLVEEGPAVFKWPTYVEKNQVT